MRGDTWLAGAAMQMNTLRLVAPTNVFDAASRVTTALTTTALYTTDPLANRLPGRPLARNWANFTCAFWGGVLERGSAENGRFVNGAFIPPMLRRRRGPRDGRRSRAHPRARRRAAPCRPRGRSEERRVGKDR